MDGLCLVVEDGAGKGGSVKLGTQRTSARDGRLVVVSRNLDRCTPVPEIAGTLQQAVENWTAVANRLAEVYERLNTQPDYGRPLDVRKLAAPLPRAYQWLDGSAYLSHVERVRKARGADMPERFLTDPLMYQGASDDFIAATDPIETGEEAWGIDFEGEIAVITDDVPHSVPPARAERHILLLMLVNDVSLRHLIPPELAKGFGFVHGKPATAFSPVAVTPDELGEHWRDCKVHLPLRCYVNDVLFGAPEAGEGMQFNFAELIAHAARTRNLHAGTIVGSGTVSNADASRGGSCIAEKRMLEVIAEGEARTPFLRFGDRVRIEMCDRDGHSIFGAIDQQVQPWKS